MRFFSKITVLCNISFLASVIFWYIEFRNKQAGNNNLAIPLPWLEGTLVVLGYGAIIINFLFLIIYLIYKAFKMNLSVARWVIVFNLVIFICQVYFHFFFKK